MARRTVSNVKRSTALLLCFVLASSAVPACRAGEPNDGSDLGTAAPILVIAVDGLEWDLVLRMLAAGRLPNFERLMQRGQYGELETLVPTYSPVVWTTVATGKTHEKHGIHHFARRTPNGDVTLFDSTDRLTKAIWNLVTDAGGTVATIGWWMTHPVEPVNGVMVAQTNTTAQLDTAGGKNIWKGMLRSGVPDQVHPPERQAEMMAILEAANRDQSKTIRRVFGDFPFPMSLLGLRLWQNCLWAFRADATYLEIALRVAHEEPRPDLTMVYFGGPDVVGHRFWRYMEPDRYEHPPTSEQRANFAAVIPDYYAYIDAAVGRLVEAFGPDATIVVLSDHGMKPVNLSAEFDPNDPPSDVNSAEHQDAPPGVLIAAGPFVRGPDVSGGVRALERDDLPRLGSVLDVTPTLLAMLRIPIGLDMDGTVLSALFRPEFAIERQPRPVATHDTEDFLRTRREKTVHAGQSERLEQLRALGYID